MAQGITIVGLGPGDPQQITREAWGVLEGATEVYLRTERHPTVAGLPEGPRYHSLDHVYEECDTFDEVYERIARTLLELARSPEGVVYAVPGHPLMGEASVVRVLALAEEAGLPTRVVSGLSFLEPVTVALRRDPFDGLQIADATSLARRYHPNLDPDVGALIVQVYSKMVAADVKMTLMNLYHDDHPILVIRAAGTPQQTVREIPLYELDRQEGVDHLTSVWVPPLTRPGSLATYQEVVARLRSPEGCPWDREQTHATLRSHLLEEAYEVLAALDADDMDALCEELGDLLLQVLLHAQIATEHGEFKMIDTVGRVIEKLVRRHPHVFGEEDVADSQEVLRNWEQIKRREREQRGGDEGSEHAPPHTESLLSGVPRALPALSRAMEVQRRAARVGFDWATIDPVRAKVSEELAELDRATDAAEWEAELGDLLFSLVNLARWHEVDAESALRQTVERFSRRFAVIERQAADEGRHIEDMTLEEMDAVWERSKGKS